MKITKNKQIIILFNCPICGKRQYEKIGKLKMSNYNLILSFCQYCGLVQLNPRLNEREYKKYYNEVYDNEYRKNNRLEIEKNNYEKIIERLDKIGIKLSDDSNILDIGSGYGGGILKIKEKYLNCKFFAIEPSKKCQNSLKKNKIKIIGNSIAETKFIYYKNKFDFIIMRHVLEHLTSPNEDLKIIQSMLSEKGIIYISVPNLNKSLVYGTTKFFRLAHVSYFNIKSLEKILNKNNIQILNKITKDENNIYEIFVACKKVKAKNINIKIEKNELLFLKKIKKQIIFEKILKLIKWKKRKKS